MRENKRKNTTFVLFALLLQQISTLEAFSGWIDPDTAEVNRTIVSYSDGNTYEIVMSDEFERSGRTFRDGDDPMWTGE